VERSVEIIRATPRFWALVYVLPGGNQRFRPIKCGWLKRTRKCGNCYCSAKCSLALRSNSLELAHTREHLLALARTLLHPLAFARPSVGSHSLARPLARTILHSIELANTLSHSLELAHFLTNSLELAHRCHTVQFLLFSSVLFLKSICYVATKFCENIFIGDYRETKFKRMPSSGWIQLPVPIFKRASLSGLSCVSLCKISAKSDYLRLS